MNTNNSTTNIPDLHPTSEEGEDGDVRPRVFLLHPNMSDVVADEGLDVSPKLVRIYDPDTADAWVMYTNGEPCKELLARKVLSSLVKRLQATNNSDMATRLEMLLQNNNVTQTCQSSSKDPTLMNLLIEHNLTHTHHHSNNNTTWNLFLLDMFDEGDRRYSNYLRLLQTIVGPNHIHYARRHFQFNRKTIPPPNTPDSWEFGDLGFRVGDRARGLHHGYNRMLRLGVRTSIVNEVQKRLKNLHHEEDPALSPRPNDVVHFWPVNGTGGELRSLVSRAVRDLGKNETTWTTKKTKKGKKKTKKIKYHYPALKTFAGVAGEMEQTGRTTVQEDYVESMLTFKIVVVCQRDRWEDHYRLMEALVSGAMVMTDPMKPLPYNFRNGTNIVVYRSIKELKHYARYYMKHEEERLQIAKQGYETSMNYHRSWNIMERLVLGNWTKEELV